jgi:pimeloyl-ACP methyl ester carboxylesterase
MQERKNRNQLQWFDEYRASKTVLFWACAGSVILATVVGFSWGGWMTGGSAQAMADKAAAQARQEVAAVVCVDRFMAARDASVQLTALQKMTSSYTQAQFVQDGGWAIMPVGNSAETSKSASSTDARKAAGLCAEELAKREIPRPSEAALIDDGATAAQ